MRIGLALGLRLGDRLPVSWSVRTLGVVAAQALFPVKIILLAQSCLLQAIGFALSRAATATADPSEVDRVDLQVLQQSRQLLEGTAHCGALLSQAS